MEYKNYYIEELPAGCSVYSGYDAWRDSEDPIYTSSSLEEARQWVDSQLPDHSRQEEGSYEPPQELELYEDKKVWSIADSGRKLLSSLIEQGYSYSPQGWAFTIHGFTAEVIVLSILNELGPLTSEEIVEEQKRRWGRWSAMPLSQTEDTLEPLLAGGNVDCRMEPRPKASLLRRSSRELARRLTQRRT